MIGFIHFKHQVTPIEQQFIAEWIGIRQGRMPRFWHRELPRPK